jgi:hypothetical protein
MGAALSMPRCNAPMHQHLCVSLGGRHTRVVWGRQTDLTLLCEFCVISNFGGEVLYTHKAMQNKSRLAKCFCCAVRGLSRTSFCTLHMNRTSTLY